MSLFNVKLQHCIDPTQDLADYIACTTVPDVGMGNFFDMSLMAGAQFLNSMGYSFWMIPMQELSFTFVDNLNDDSYKSYAQLTYEMAQDEYDYLSDEDFVSSVW